MGKEQQATIKVNAQLLEKLRKLAKKHGFLLHALIEKGIAIQIETLEGNK